MSLMSLKCVKKLRSDYIDDVDFALRKCGCHYTLRRGIVNDNGYAVVYCYDVEDAIAGIYGWARRRGEKRRWYLLLALGRAAERKCVCSYEDMECDCWAVGWRFNWNFYTIAVDDVHMLTWRSGVWARVAAMIAAKQGKEPRRIQEMLERRETLVAVREDAVENAKPEKAAEELLRFAVETVLS